MIPVEEKPAWLAFLQAHPKVESVHTSRWKEVEYTLLEMVCEDLRYFEVFIPGIQFPYYSEESVLVEAKSAVPSRFGTEQEAARYLSIILNSACLEGDVFRGVLRQYSLFQPESCKQPILSSYDTIVAHNPPASKIIIFPNEYCIPVFESPHTAESLEEADFLSRATIEAYLDHKEEILTILQKIDQNKQQVFQTRDLYKRHLLLESWGWHYLYTSVGERRSPRRSPSFS